MKCLALALAGLSLSACALDEDDDDLVDTASELSVRLSPGVNGHYCAASPYNCRFHEGSSRVMTQGGDESWGVATGYSIRDGNGVALYTQTGSRLTFNYGQTRLLAGKAHALALTTSNSSAGWYPIDAILGEASFRKQNGEVNAKDPDDGRMACYRVRDSADSSIELKKVVYDSKVGIDGHERAGDYLPLVRANGKRSVNLVFSVPGFALGGATTDHFLSGETFHRVRVPTDSGLDPALGARRRRPLPQAQRLAPLPLRLHRRGRWREALRLDGRARAASARRLLIEVRSSQAARAW